MPFNLPAIAGLSSNSGFEYQLQTLEGKSPEELLAVTNEIINAARANPKLSSVLTWFSADSPRVQLEIDRKKALALGVSIADIFTTMQTMLGGSYVNDFNLYGRTWDVRAQGDIAERRTLEDIFKINIKNILTK